MIIQSWRMVPDQEKSCKRRNLFVLCFLEFRYTVLSRGIWKVYGRSPINQIRSVSLVANYPNPRAPGGLSAKPGGQSARALKSAYIRELLADSPPGH
jgi:hypothetical protein